jgi:hypothetical protein
MAGYSIAHLAYPFNLLLICTNFSTLIIFDQIDCIIGHSEMPTISQICQGNILSAHIQPYLVILNVVASVTVCGYCMQFGGSYFGVLNNSFGESHLCL